MFCSLAAIEELTEKRSGRIYRLVGRKTNRTVTVSGSGGRSSRNTFVAADLEKASASGTHPSAPSPPIGTEEHGAGPSHCSDDTSQSKTVEEAFTWGDRWLGLALCSPVPIGDRIRVRTGARRYCCLLSRSSVAANCSRRPIDRLLAKAAVRVPDRFSPDSWRDIQQQIRGDILVSIGGGILLFFFLLLLLLLRVSGR